MHNDNKTLTPVMKQYWAVKSNHPDKILLFQMGDFYEMFYKDAEMAAPILNIALTSRNKKFKDSVPMCGVPLSAIAKTVSQLLRAGHKTAICDQVESATPGKAIVERKVTRILSPGMTYDPSFLDELKAHYLCAFDHNTVSFTDESTGEAFCYNTSSIEERQRLIHLIEPVEIVFAEHQKNELPKEGSHFSLHNQLCSSIKAPESIQRLLSYTQYMKRGTTLKKFEKRYADNHLYISALTHKHLEVTKTFEGHNKGSLFFAVNRTKTSSGARLLKSHLLSPLTCLKSIEKRLNRVEYFIHHNQTCSEVREKLKAAGDLERHIGKVCSPSVNARDLLTLAHSVEAGLQLLLEDDSQGAGPKKVYQSMEAVHNLAACLIKDINDAAPLSLKEGRLFNFGVDKELDSLIQYSENSKKMMADLEIEERKKTGIPSLKIRSNQVFGYYIEITKTHTHKAPPHYFRKQTLTHAERYSTEPLKVLEEKTLTAQSKRAETEYQMFLARLEQIQSLLAELRLLARGISHLDVASSLAFLAVERNYTRPVFSNAIKLSNSRHPVIEQDRTFTPNTIEMNPEECLLLTGPNMAGKSTLMRQTALNVLLAQAGSYVPAQKAELPLFRKILTRIGSSDRLHSGLSTFMVEMTETGDIIQHADENSLIILDELGRGTSTYDGLSLAQALLEYLMEKNKSYIMFSTHYHELTRLIDPKIKQGHLAVRECGNQIDFLYTLRSGSCQKSYGIDVGEKAGLPPAVIQRARELMAGFEKSSPKEKNISPPPTG